MGEIVWKRDLPTKDYQTTHDVGHCNKVEVPPINKEQNDLMAHSCVRDLQLGLHGMQQIQCF